MVQAPIGYEILVIATMVWTICAVVWLRFGEKRLASPTFLYLLFHLLSFVLRPWFIYSNGNQIFLQQYIGIWPTEADHTRTLWLVSAGLVAWLSGSLIGEARARRHGRAEQGHTINEGVMASGGTVLVALGLVSYWLYAPKEWIGSERSIDTGMHVVSDAGFRTSISTTSAYLTSFYTVIIGVFIVWICFWGMRWYFAAFLIILFTAFILLGQDRNTYLLGAMAISLAMMGRKGRRWPTKKLSTVLILVLLSFLAGKHWLTTWIQRGPRAALEQAVESISQNQTGESALFINYDMLLAVIYLIPDYAPHSYFGLLLRPFYFWVPRAMWSGKPVFDFPAAYIGNMIPEINFTGFVVTLVGESYLAFGPVGVVSLLFLYSALISFGHVWAFRFPVASVERVFGIALSVSMVLVFRDGIISLPQYMLFYLGPCLLLWIGSKAFSRDSTPYSVEQSPAIQRHANQQRRRDKELPPRHSEQPRSSFIKRM